MKTSIKNYGQCFLAVLFASVSSLCCAPAHAQDGGFTVVLDVARVFKDHQKFEGAMKQIQQEAEQLRVQMQGEQESLQAEAARVMETFKPGSAEFQREETRLEQQQAALRTRARQLNEELLNKEAKLYHDTYLHMEEVVKRIANDHNIALVLRYDSSEIDPNNRGDVIKAVNRGVVFQKELDITDMVIQQMKSGTASIVSPNTNR